MIHPVPAPYVRVPAITRFRIRKGIVINIDDYIYHSSFWLPEHLVSHVEGKISSTSVAVPEPQMAEISGLSGISESSHPAGYEFTLDLVDRILLAETRKLVRDTAVTTLDT